MTETIVYSKQHVPFTSSSLKAMRQYYEGLQGGTAPVLCCMVGFNKDNELLAAFGGDHQPQQASIEDQIGDVTFYWYTDQRCMEALRSYCMDVEWKRQTRLIRLPGKEG